MPHPTCSSGRPGLTSPALRTRPLAATLPVILGATLMAALTPSAGWAQTSPSAGDVLRDNLRSQPLPAPKDDARIPVPENVRPAMQGARDFRTLVRGFRFSGNHSISDSELQLLVLDGLGKENSYDDLERWADVVSNHYRAKGFFVARAYLPQQEIRDGVVELTILEGQVGRRSATLAGHARTRPFVIESILESSVAAGAVVHEDAIERAALVVNDLPGMSAAIRLEPGEASGLTDVRLSASEDSLVSGSVDLDNFGNRYTGQTRLGATLNLNSPTGLGDQLSLRLMKSNGDLDFARLSYQVPVGGRGTRVGLAYSRVTFEVCCQIGLTPSGRGTVATAYALHPIVRSRNISWYANASLDAKQSVNDAGIGSARRRDVDLLTLGSSVESRDGVLGGGMNFINVALASGRLRIGDAADRAADAASAQAAGAFHKLGLQLARTQRLTDRLSAYAGVNAQYARNNLDAMEKFSLGGAQGVRAYPGGEAAGDQGHVAQAELRMDLPLEAAGALWQAFVFADHGSIRLNRNDFTAGTGVRNSYSLAAWGVGLNVARAGVFQVRASWARKVGDNPGRNPLNGTDSDGRSSRSRLWLQAVMQF